MNQILQTTLNKNKNKLHFFKFQFFISSIFLLFLTLYIIYSNSKYKKIENFSNNFFSNYNITKLYQNSYITENSNILGIIEIKSINVYYPIFSTYSDDLLKISPCKFYGTLPGKKGNLCIVGHNYENYKFFSNIYKLKKNDIIILYDNFNNKFSYLIYDIYEVKKSDFSPIYNFDKNKKILTLITCNNLNKNRIIVKSILN